MTYVYFAKRAGFIKIGMSRDPHARSRSLRAQLIGVLNKPGNRSVEMQLHSRFSHYSARVPELGVDGKTEWFRDSWALRSFMRTHVVPMGPPRRRAVSNLQVMIPGDLHRRLKLAAAEEGVTMKSIILQLCKEIAGI